MLTEEIRLDKMEIPGADNATINLRFVHVIMRDGVEISRQYIRRVITHGDDLDGLPANVQAIAHTLWGGRPPPAPAEDPTIEPAPADDPITDPAPGEEVMP